MKKILIISYFYPPCNLTAAQRVQGWAKYLHASGYYPIVVTRNWDNLIKKPEDVLRSSGDETRIEKNDTHEVHYLPYHAGIRDKLFTRLEGTRIQWLSKIFTFLAMVMENFLINFIPHKNIYYYSSQLLTDDSTIKTVVISGNPFNQFSFGYHLKKKFSIQWIADYRDDWSTSELKNKSHGASSFIKGLQQKSEKKWVGSAALITSVSDYYVKKIATFVDRPGLVLLNGYDFELSKTPPKPDQNIFRITYNGSLYESQPIEIFINALKKVIQNNEVTLPIELHFPGLAFDPSQKKRVETLTTDISTQVFISPRLPKEEVIELQLKSDLLLMVAHTNIKGIPSSKLFEYIGLNRPILVVPSDKDIIHTLISNSNSGYCIESESECTTLLKTLIEKKQNNEPLMPERNEAAAKQYTRKNQSKVLAKALDKLKS